MPQKPREKTLQFRLTPQEYEELDIASEALGIPKASLIRQALKEFYKSNLVLSQKFDQPKS